MSPGDLISHYELVRRLGRGGMGEVWEAVDTRTERRVALKLITSPDPELRRRLVREARAIGRLEHPNIVQVLALGETPAGEPFLVMQLLQGETLQDRMRREGTLPVPVAAAVAVDIARALRVAHDKQIIHRDLKPANIFLHQEPDTDEHVVKVVDFGVSKLHIENEGGATMPQPGSGRADMGSAARPPCRTWDPPRGPRVGHGIRSAVAVSDMGSAARPPCRTWDPLRGRRVGHGIRSAAPVSDMGSAARSPCRTWDPQRRPVRGRAGVVRGPRGVRAHAPTPTTTRFPLTWSWGGRPPRTPSFSADNPM